MTPLVTDAYVTGKIALTAAQAAVIDDVNAAASRAVRKWCNRDFTRQTYDELYTALGPRDAILLNQYPVNQVNSVRANPMTALSVTNNDTVNNQRAQASLAFTGSQDAGLTLVGINLTRWTFGSQHVDQILFTSLPQQTIGALATAITNLGNGWSASASSNDGDTDYPNWPVSDLVAVSAGTGARSPKSATFTIHTTDLDFTPNLDDGLVHIDVSSDSVFNNIRFGPFLVTDLDDPRVFGANNGLRINYDAGYDTIPEAVQLATVLTIKNLFDQARRDFTKAGESWEDYRYEQVQWEAMDAAIPLPAEKLLSLWRSHRA